MALDRIHTAPGGMLHTGVQVWWSRWTPAIASIATPRDNLLSAMARNTAVLSAQLVSR